jgi:hypothetical protein
MMSMRAGMIRVAWSMMGEWVGGREEEERMRAIAKKMEGEYE